MGEASPPSQSGDSSSTKPEARSRGSLGPFLCWAVVFADIGTSVYYTPGILFGQFGTHAALFVAMTLVVFVLLTMKYAEVSVRYPEGGGVVTVASQAIHPFAGALGGMLILVDYFLTAAISALSGLIYLSVVAPSLASIVLPATLVALVALAALNLVGISASAEASAVIASIAAASQLFVVGAVVAHVGVDHVPATLSRVFSGPKLAPVGILTGYAGAFLAFSGLESIAQLAPSMQQPRRRVSHLAMGAVVATVGLTSPLLTLWSTTLLDAKRSDPNQFISLLAGVSAGRWLEIEVALSAAVLLVFASNTALIGSYHVFIALSRMHFLPSLLERRNRLRGSPHWAILVAVAVPVLVVLATRGNVGLLGDLYAFGLLGAFTMTCVSLDIVRWHERHPHPSPAPRNRGREGAAGGRSNARGGKPISPPSRLVFSLGVLTTACVTVAWVTNLFAKPLATLFGGSVTVFGLGIAFVTLELHEHRGEFPVFPLLHRSGSSPLFLSRARKARPVAILAILPRDPAATGALIEAAAIAAAGRPIAFLQHGTPGSPTKSPRLFEVIDPYLDDQAAQEAFGRVERLGRQRHLDRRYIYLPSTAEPDAVTALWQALDPEEGLVVGADEALLSDAPADRTYTTDAGSVPILHVVALR